MVRCTIHVGTKRQFIYNEYFTSVFSKEDTSYIPPPDGYTPFLAYHQLMLPLLHGVTVLLSNLKIHKASGPDKIPASLLKNLATTLAPMIFKASLSQSSLLSQWKIYSKLNIVPIFKKGN